MGNVHLSGATGVRPAARVCVRSNCRQGLSVSSSLMGRWLRIKCRHRIAPNQTYGC